MKITFFNSIWLKIKTKYDKSTFCRFQEFLGVVNTFTAKAFSERNPIMHFNKHIFRSQHFQKYLIYQAHFFFFFFFLKHSKFQVDSKNLSGIAKQVYCFLDHLISICNAKFSLLLQEHSQFPINVLSSSPKISNLIENNFFSLNLAQNEDKIG